MRKKRILIGNSARSLIAEGLIPHEASDRVNVFRREHTQHPCVMRLSM